MPIPSVSPGEKHKRPYVAPTRFVVAIVIFFLFTKFYRVRSIISVHIYRAELEHRRYYRSSRTIVNSFCRMIGVDAANRVSNPPTNDRDDSHIVRVSFSRPEQVPSSEYLNRIGYGRFRKTFVAYFRRHETSGPGLLFRRKGLVDRR